MNRELWRGRSVLVTGHTGFKGSWLSLWLQQLDAKVHGYALAPPTSPSLFQVADISNGMTHTEGDIRDLQQLSAVMAVARPEIVFHLAAQSLVRKSYRDPLDTMSSNVMGTANLLEAIRGTPSVKVVVVVTSDKCYDNRERMQPYLEDEALGGKDPYSASKACAEIVTAAWRDSFLSDAGVSVATVRAGNVIGGGDWADDRLLPDAFRAWQNGKPLTVRNPNAVRPWQHVLEPLAGYLMLAENLYRGEAVGAWNFGPTEGGMYPVGTLLDRMAQAWGEGANWQADSGRHPHEAGLLCLDSGKARTELGWQPKYDLDQALRYTIDWHRSWMSGDDMRAVTMRQITQYMLD
jgi:CDP-glucose 4,6-dehydratase